MFKQFFANTRKPVGLGGKIMLGMMNSGHSRLSKWAFENLEDLKEDDDVLDIGCGGGANIKKMLAYCTKGTVSGLDYSAESVAKSRKLNTEAIAEGRCKIVEGNVLDLPFEEASFDFVTAFETVYFWPNMAQAFANVHQVLKSGGYFMIVNEASGSDVAKWEDIIDGLKIYSQAELTELLEAAGFIITDIHTKEKPSWLMLVAKKV